MYIAFKRRELLILSKGNEQVVSNGAAVFGEAFAGHADRRMGLWQLRYTSYRWSLGLNKKTINISIVYLCIGVSFKNTR